MKTCPNCERPLSPGMTRCPYCGSSVPTTSDEMLYASFYNSPIQYYATYDDATRPEKTIHGYKSITTAPLPSPRAKRTSAFLITAIIIVTLLLVISGASLIYYAGIIHPAQLHTQATSTALARQSASQHAKATAQAHSTSTAQAAKKAEQQATATAHAQTTIHVRATTTSQQNLYAQSTRGAPTFSSPLFFDTGDNWDIYPTKDGGGCTFTDNALHSSVFQTDYYAPCIAHKLHVQNFALELQMTILKGEEGGIIFRSNTNDKNFYSFRLKRDGTYGLIVTRDDGHTTPLVYDKSTLIKTGNGKTNIVTIIARANIIYLYINKHYVGSASDDTYRAGAIGVLAVDRQDGTDVAFNNLRLWKL